MQSDNMLITRPAAVKALNRQQASAAKKQQPAIAPPEEKSAYEKQRDANIAENNAWLAARGLAMPSFASCKLADTLTQLEYSDALLQKNQRVAVYYNDELGWLSARISAVQKRATWVIYDGEQDEYKLPCKKEHGKKWVFVTDKPAPAASS